jgi:hypothetical protein
MHSAAEAGKGVSGRVGRKNGQTGDPAQLNLLPGVFLAAAAAAPAVFAIGSWPELADQGRGSAHDGSFRFQPPPSAL